MTLTAIETEYAPSSGVLDDLYTHMEWADALVWSATLKTKGATTDTVLRAKFHHVHQTQRAFLELWTEQFQPLPEAEDFSDLNSVVAWAHPYYAEVRAFLEAVDADALTRVVPAVFRERMEQNFGQGAPAVTLRDTVLQVPTHTAHHRGQINARLRELGGEPPLVDFIIWVWAGRPAPPWKDVWTDPDERRRGEPSAGQPI